MLPSFHNVIYNPKQTVCIKALTIKRPIEQNPTDGKKNSTLQESQTGMCTIFLRLSTQQFFVESRVKTEKISGKAFQNRSLSLKINMQRIKHYINKYLRLK